MVARTLALLAIVGAGCGGAGAPDREPHPSAQRDAALAIPTQAPGNADAVTEVDEPSSAAVSPPVPPAVPPAPVGAVWLRGSTHVHGKASGDSTTPVADVIAWYESHGYDFIALTDHNRVSEVDGVHSTAGQVAVRAPTTGLIVLAGVELTHNPDGCTPPGDGTPKCRIHANLIGVTARPTGKLAWANRQAKDRYTKYQGALDQRAALGGLAQVNHGQWYWGMSAALLADLARSGFELVEIENTAFSAWMAGDAAHPSMEALWDATLAQQLPLWGVAVDDAHHYQVPGKYPAGGGWIRVLARREPAAIVEAIRVGRFYASTGVELTRAEVQDDALVVDAVVEAGAQLEIDLVQSGRVVATVAGASLRYPLPSTGYVRAVVRRIDAAGAGKRAWVQPQWRQPRAVRKP